VAFFVCVLLPVSFCAGRVTWGRAGHAVGAAVAQRLLSDRASAQVTALLPETSGSLADVSSWADTVRSRLPWSSGFHFADVPDWLCNYNHARDCANEYCVDGAIQNYTRRVHDVAEFDQRNEALKFLVHFIGDTHQPLHCGFLSDLGGNQLTGTFMGSRTNLHSLWDTGLISKRIDDDFGSDEEKYISYLHTQVLGPWDSEAQRWAACTARPYAACSDVWAHETAIAACDHAYVDADGKTRLQIGYALADAYYHRNIPLVEIQIAKSAVRLAAVLNAVFA